MVTGILDGMVMQRNTENVADIIVYSQNEIKKIEYSTDSVSVKITAEHIGENRYKVKGIPVGGPYTVTVDDEVFKDIYVGDVWILAGQSNMQGVGRLRNCDLEPDKKNNVRAFFMDDKWRLARHPLHYAWIENCEIHSEEISETVPADKYQGVGPGLKFAQALEAKNGVPQGLICTAYGGSPLKMWLPSMKAEFKNNSLYSAMYNRVCMNGSRVAGMLWFQGCADAFDCESDKFLQRTVEFFEGVRKDFGLFPIIQFQIGRVVHPEHEGLKENWMKIREIQSKLHKKVDMLYTISSITQELDDLIHISADSADFLGLAAANAVSKFKQGGFYTQELESITLCEDEKSKKAILKVTFKNLSGKLCSSGRPSGFTVSEQPYTLENDVVFDVKLQGNTANIYLWCTTEEAKGKYLCYGFGLNPYCNITDSENQAVLCFGPLKIGE